MIRDLTEWLKKHNVETLLSFCILLVFILAAHASTGVAYVMALTIISILIYFILQVTKTVKIRQQRLVELDKANRENLLDNSLDYNPDTVITDIVNNLKNATEFVREMGKGNFEARLKGITEQNFDQNKKNLAGELVSMKIQMKTSAEEERRRVWSTQGLANFGDLLRNASNDLAKLSEEVVIFIVKYLKANQGGIFILNEEDQSNKFLELRAAYAFERKKYLVKKISVGEGLVGQTYLEKETIYLKKIPANYISITSGLGGSSPHALVLIPLKVENEVLGVLEIASFKNFEKHEIEFCEKIGETIASAISDVKINERTRNLLEQSQQQSEEMRAQEEEMRQNMEELQATQEEMSRKEKDYVRKIEDLQKALQTSTSTSSNETVKVLEHTIDTLTLQIAEQKNKLEQLNTLSEQHINWDNLEQVEKDLRISLEAAEIAQSALKRNPE